MTLLSVNWIDRSTKKELTGKVIGNRDGKIIVLDSLGREFYLLPEQIINRRMD
jgi:hypothetical protein